MFFQREHINKKNTDKRTPNFTNEPAIFLSRSQLEKNDEGGVQVFLTEDIS